MNTVTLGEGHRVRLPAEVTRRLRLRKGVRLAVVTSGDSVTLVPWSRIPNDQRYFYTDEWQAKEAEADRDIAQGKIRSFDDVEDAIRELRSPVLQERIGVEQRPRPERETASAAGRQ